MTGLHSFQIVPNAWTIDRLSFVDVHHGHYTVRLDRSGHYECAYRRSPTQEWDVFAVDVGTLHAAILECQADMQRMDRETFLPLDVEF